MKLTSKELELVRNEITNELEETFEGVNVNVSNNEDDTITVEMSFEGKHRSVVKDLNDSIDNIINDIKYLVYKYTTEEIDEYSDDYDEDEIRRVNELNEWNNN